MENLLTEGVDPTRYTKNVQRLLKILFFAVSTSAVALGPLFDAYLLNIGGDHGNGLVGAVESTRGLLQITFGFPIGWLSDKMSRVRLVKRTLPIWTCGLGIMIAGVVSDTVFLIFAGMVLWAPCSQCWNSTAQVLMAESVDAAARTKNVANMTSVRMLANAVGPLLQLVLLLILRQNHWGNGTLHAVIAAGSVFWPFVVLWTCRLDDLEPLEKAQGLRNSRPGNFSTEDLERCVCGIQMRWWLAGSLEITSLVTAIGAGMTVKFFPLFFRVDYKFTPIEVCTMSFAAPVCVSMMVQACRRLSKYLGRLQTIVVFHFLGTSTLWIMCVTRPLYAMIPLFLLRGSFNNAKAPIGRSIIMDLVTSEYRGRWNFIQSINMFSWSGSAFLGGMIADRAGGDYRYTFAVTATIYTLTGLLYLPLLLVFPRETVARSTPVEMNRHADTRTALQPTISESRSVQLLEQSSRAQEENMKNGRADGKLASQG